MSAESASDDPTTDESTTEQSTTEESTTEQSTSQESGEMACPATKVAVQCKKRVRRNGSP